MIKGPWRYDERTGMVAVYSGEERNCLDLPSECFVYVRYWEQKPEGIGFDQIEEDREVARLIAAAPELLAGCKASLGAFERGDAIDWDEIRRAIEKAEGEL